MTRLEYDRKNDLRIKQNIDLILRLYTQIHSKFTIFIFQEKKQIPKLTKN
jgi:hypothetical protein